MFSQRAHISLLHSPAAVDAAARTYNTMRKTARPMQNCGVFEKLRRVIPHLNYAPDARFPIIGAAVQNALVPRVMMCCGVGYARAADGFGVDILQNCEVTAVRRKRTSVTGLDITRLDHSK